MGTEKYNGIMGTVCFWKSGIQQGYSKEVVKRMMFIFLINCFRII
jgi:hypothetical protein